MTCLFSKELLALHVEGDLSADEAAPVVSHVGRCAECAQFLEDLGARQSLLKSLRRETFNSADCAAMRRDVMSNITESQSSTRWPVRIERALTLGFRRRGFVFASFALVLCLVSVSLWIPMQHGATEAGSALSLPSEYRNWVSVAQGARSNVYISPAAYLDYVKSGEFPEGTMMVNESASGDVQMSLKDSSRFKGGWGFFDFTGSKGQPKSKAVALAEENACRFCHERNAETDHVFTQFYPGLRPVRAVSSLTMPGRIHAITKC